MKCITTVSYVILFKGCPSKKFKATQGLLQGDPLSSYLFAISMEYLSRSFRTMELDGFEYHSRCHKVKLIELMFADNLLIFTKGNANSVRLVADRLQNFSSASGLQVSPMKSSVYMGGIMEEAQNEILRILGISFPVRYLGVPLTTRML